MRLRALRLQLIQQTALSSPSPWCIPSHVPLLPPLLLQFMLGCALESVEVTATRFFLFQPIQGV